jgi:hypothetical protein
MVGARVAKLNDMLAIGWRSVGDSMVAGVLGGARHVFRPFE